jgi:hypothetical protein
MMNPQQPVIEWNDRKQARFSLKWPAFEFSIRDCVWLLVLAVLTAVYVADRWRNASLREADQKALQAALAKANAAADEAQQELADVNDQLRLAREAFTTLEAEDRAIIANLRRQIAGLQQEQAMRTTPPPGDSERRER